MFCINDKVKIKVCMGIVSAGDIGIVKKTCHGYCKVQFKKPSKLLKVSHNLLTRVSKAQKHWRKIRTFVKTKQLSQKLARATAI